MNAPSTTLTRRDLAEKGIDALDPAKLATADVHHRAGQGVSQVNLPQVVEVAKFMAVAGQGVPKHCRENVGICLRITFQAVEWQMSPFSVADMSFIVNDRIAYMSQLIHAVVEARAPLQHRLECKYDGEGLERSCTVIGQFTTGDTREYTSPMIKDIKTKNSPLWKDDPDQQLFYFASRSWARKWCPDVLLGVYTREELADQAPFEPDAGSGLHARLTGGADRSAEGHSPEHARAELDQVAGSGKTIEGDAVLVDDADKAGGKRTKAKKGKAEPATDDDSKVAAAMPKNPAEYAVFAKKWIDEMTDADALAARWDAERPLRNNCGLTEADRNPIMAQMKERREQIEAAGQ